MTLPQALKEYKIYMSLLCLVHKEGCNLNKPTLVKTTDVHVIEATNSCYTCGCWQLGYYTMLAVGPEDFTGSGDYFDQRLCAGMHSYTVSLFCCNVFALRIILPTSFHNAKGRNCRQN